MTWRLRPGFWRFIFLLVLCGGAIFLSAKCSAHSSNAYEEELCQLDSASYRAAWLAEGTKPRRDTTLKYMSDQNGLLFQWSVVLLGAIAAVMTTSKVHKIPRIELVYVFLAPSAVFLLGSINLGINFQRSLAYLVSRDLLHPPALNEYLYNQGQLLLFSLLFLVLFVLAFYLSILFGGTKPTESKA